MSLMHLPENYEPSEKEPYMCDMHLQYFKNKLLNKKQELLHDSRETLEHLQETGLSQPDLNDQAALEFEATLELRNGDRKRKLLNKIEEALVRIESGEYGYCEDTGEPIGIARLKARPIATLCIEAQERHERDERQFSDSDDDELDDSSRLAF